MYQNNQNLCIKHKITTIKRKQKASYEVSGREQKYDPVSYP